MIVNGSLPDGMVPAGSIPDYAFPMVMWFTSDNANGFMPKYAMPNGAFPDQVWPRIEMVGFFRDLNGVRYMIDEGAGYRLIKYEV